MTHDRSSNDGPAWNARYAEGELPWDSGEPDAHLREVLEAYDIPSGSALEIGCGTGTNAIWLAQQGFEVTGLDVAPNAVARAEEKAAAAGVACRFVARDVLVDEVPGSARDFVYDRGCFHVFDRAEDRERFASRVHDLLAPGGLWHSLIGSADGPPRDHGPPQRSAAEVAAAVEPYFEILKLESTRFDGERHGGARAWVLVARRRDRPAG